jgi:hypothetical protein
MIDAIAMGVTTDQASMEINACILVRIGCGPEASAIAKGAQTEGWHYP